ncbi:Glucan endo-1,3-beta-glucosidase btgC [Heracleum sosnowskyi]|uniref:Glucan endo-1,3-beta-glucosidase btgC n=1 Tax=Heracleum sosnowskyi TaxID=360622 RepID=A0AAD8H0E4_9APIA|nr:Glucan endo-1,3-beta-glucosidase btgC [Heracleum sosnowskyi]
MVIVSTSPSSPQLFTIFNPKKHHHSHKHQASSLFISSHLSSKSLLYPKRCKLNHNPPNSVISPSKFKHSSRIYAISENLQLAEVTPVENSEQLVTTTAASGDGVSNIISVLLFIAFVGLSVLTIGVIYIAVTDYLQKREREKFEKEESAKKKKANKKRKVKARAGPKGFGQKIIEVDEDDDS